MLERMAMLVNNPASVKYEPNHINNNETLIKVCTPLINYTISPMLYHSKDREYFYPRVGRAVVVVPRVYPEPPPEDASEFEAFYSTKIAEGPTTRPYNDGVGANSIFQVIDIVNTTPYEYFECHHLTVATMGDHWQILGGDNPLFNAEVTETITDSAAGQIRLGYRKFTHIESGDDLPDVHWLQEFDQEGELMDIKRPCINALGGGDISVDTKCLVEQEAGGLWTIVAVEC